MSFSADKGRFQTSSDKNSEPYRRLEFHLHLLQRQHQALTQLLYVTTSCTAAVVQWIVCLAVLILENPTRKTHLESFISSTGLAESNREKNLPSDGNHKHCWPKWLQLMSPSQKPLTEGLNGRNLRGAVAQILSWDLGNEMYPYFDSTWLRGYEMYRHSIWEAIELVITSSTII